jgi:chromosome segregation ATPase
MGAVLGEKVYRLLETRPRVLVNSLLRGRAKWKEKCTVAKVELQAFRGKVRDLEVSREKWRVQAEEAEDQRQDLAQQLEQAKEQNKRLEERIAALEADKKKGQRR